MIKPSKTFAYRVGFLTRKQPAIALTMILGTVGASAAFAQLAAAPTDTSGQSAVVGQLQEIVVTAQKREQSINSVPMSVTAVTGQQLEAAGITNTAGLAEVVPGFTFGKNENGTQTYNIRGVGYDGYGIGTAQAVAIYVDQAPLPFALETTGALFDTERVEVLEGPQGLLYGENSTAGAVDYIENKPTSTLQAGQSLTYGRFNEVDVSGYLSGPVTDTLSMRVAVEHQGMGEWQDSVTRPAQSGQVDFTNARLSALWKPTSNLTALFTLSAWIDRSDFIYPQAVELLDRFNPTLLADAGLSNYPAGPRDDEQADWPASANAEENNRFLNLTSRLNYDISNTMTLTSLTSYIDYSNYIPSALGGTDTIDNSIDQVGEANTYYQELRLSYDTDRIHAIVGGNYEYDDVDENSLTNISNSTAAYAFYGLTGLKWNTLRYLSDQKFHTHAAFGNVEYTVVPKVTLQGGLRFTQTDIALHGCTADSGDGNAAANFTAFINDLFRAPAGLPPIPLIPNGGCTTFNSTTLLPGFVNSTLDQNNVSWRAGVKYEPVSGLLLYANASKGYKAGGYQPIAATADSGLDPAKQESVLAYEAGIKTSLLNHTVQVSGAGFYDNYNDKQITGTKVDPAIGPESVLVNVPKSRIYGVEFQITAIPYRGLTLNAAGTYLRSDVLDNYSGVNGLGVTENFNDSDLPYAPHVQLSGGARYEWELNDSKDLFTSVNAVYTSKSYALMGDLPELAIDAYTLVNLTAGIESSDGKWRVYGWGRNITDTTYWYTVQRSVDTLGRYMGMPATYGVTVDYRF